MSSAPNHNELPLPDYDHLPLGTLPSRISGLDEQGVAALLEYETQHGNRLPVVQVLQERLDALRQGATPSGSVQQDTPEVSQGHAGSKVSPATSGPPMNPPSHGDPTNPAQPR
ncbi:hypothetical protein [Arthrobacter mobilis]|uniref:DUF8129 domain-containing protein n=1 Tax=Arthrobacter mobilis TaxID=2724944 RepID=A0A7X6K6K6_9MICC|nr:hypothetical protein [Arthrobacter mobilis]NKX55490.1 hypothetical protein [Arthrobacter mobilis]